MKIVRTAAELPHSHNQTVGFVPTMGAFHEGHLDLMRRARQENELVVVSLFVNPTQFGKGEDFDRYPRDLERDSGMAESVGVDVLFAPEVREVYPNLPTSSVHVPEITERWEGSSRPGHFDGVATVVTKLFQMVRPHVAYFGQKDLQQCRVIQRMVEDLFLPLKVQICPTTREPDGLAMSSRNVYLLPEERAIAPMIHDELSRCAGRFRTSTLQGTEVDEVIESSRSRLKSAGFQVDYFQWVDMETLAPTWTEGTPSAMIAAVKLGRTRLIDNVIL